jgi:hypothetical protein
MCTLFQRLYNRVKLALGTREFHLISSCQITCLAIKWYVQPTK